jgi:hypothetical protein
MKKSDEKNLKHKGSAPAGRLLLNKETIRNLLTDEELRLVNGGAVNLGGDTGDDGKTSRNDHSGH